MRDIKFRAWDKVCDCYVEEEWCLYSNGCISVGGSWATGSVDIEQFTGLLDRNGVEIYEGDIVDDGCQQNYHCISGVHLVEFKNGAFLPFAVPGWEGTMDSDMCEVIGNLHQNPELLK